MLQGPFDPSSYVIPFDSIGTTVFIAELVQQLKSRDIDLDRLAAHRSRQAGTNLQAAQAMAQDVTQPIQTWLPTYHTPDPSSQQCILELEAELAKMKGNQSSLASQDKATPPTPATTTIPARLLMLCMVDLVLLLHLSPHPCWWYQDTQSRCSRTTHQII